MVLHYLGQSELSLTIPDTARESLHLKIAVTEYVLVNIIAIRRKGMHNIRTARLWWEKVEIHIKGFRKDYYDDRIIDWKVILSSLMYAIIRETSFLRKSVFVLHHPGVRLLVYIIIYFCLFLSISFYYVSMYITQF